MHNQPSMEWLLSYHALSQQSFTHYSALWPTIKKTSHQIYVLTSQSPKIAVFDRLSRPVDPPKLTKIWPAISWDHWGIMGLAARHYGITIQCIMGVMRGGKFWRQVRDAVWHIITSLISQFIGVFAFSAPRWTRSQFCLVPLLVFRAKTSWMPRVCLSKIGRDQQADQSSS